MKRHSIKSLDHWKSKCHRQLLRSLAWSEQLSSRRLAFLVFTVALLPRLVLVAVWQVRFPHGVFPDEVSYIRLANQIASGEITPEESGFWSSNWAFFRPLASFAEISGNSALLGRLAVATCGALLAVVVLFLGRRLSVRTGVIAAFVIALYPSQIFWSSMILKDTVMALLFAFACLMATAVFAGTSLPTSIFAGLGLTSATLLISGVRIFGAASLSLAFLIALLWHLVTHTRNRTRIISITVVVLAAFSLFALVRDRIPLQGTAGNESVRALEYQSAKTLISCRPISFLPGTDTNSSGWVNDLACSPHSLRMVLFDPFPNQLGKSVSLLPPFIEQIIWLPLITLALLSFALLKRNNHLVFPAILFLGLALQWALIDRVFGTAFRHRTEFVWIVVLLASARLTLEGGAQRPKRLKASAALSSLGWWKRALSK